MLERRRPRKSPVAPRRKAKEMSRSAYGGGEREVRSPLTVGICILGTATRWGKPLPCVGKAGSKDLLADTQARLEKEAGGRRLEPGPGTRCPGAPEHRSGGADRAQCIFPPNCIPHRTARSSRPNPASRAAVFLGVSGRWQHGTAVDPTMSFGQTTKTLEALVEVGRQMAQHSFHVQYSVLSQ